ncbi:MAG: hypothetical protein QW568_00785 [Candidatus Anstonellaceae archaeon]
MDDQQERTIIISSRDLVDHTVLTRKKNELAFRKELLLKSGAKDGDLHLSAVENEIAAIEAKLSPLEEKLSVADMITVLPHRKEIGEFTQKINQYSRAELDLAVKNKTGDAYELMKKRAVLVKSNFERKEDIARLTILLNTFPRKEGEALRQLIEEGSGADVDVSFLPKEKQQELVNLTARLGKQCCIYSGSFSLDKKKAELAELKAADEVRKTIAGGKSVWVEAGKLSAFDENEKNLNTLLAKIQSKTAEKQARQLTEEEQVYFDKIQGDYLEAVKKRSEIARGMDLSETAKLYRKNLKPENDW